MPLPFDTSEYDDYENPAPVIKVGGLSAQDATDPYAIYQKQALEANAAKWKAKTEALQAARLEAPDKMERITQALLAFGAPTHGNNWAALSNATKALAMSGNEANAAQRERTNQLAQLRAQQEDAAAAIKEKYGFESAKDESKRITDWGKPSNPPALAPPVFDKFGRRIDQGGNLVPNGFAVDNRGKFINLNGASLNDENKLNLKYPSNNVPLPETSSENKVTNYKNMSDLINAPVGTFGTFNGESFRIEAGGPIKLNIPSNVTMSKQIQEAIDKGLTGDEFLATLDSPTSNQVRAILEGRAPVPTGARSSPRSQMLAELAAQADPRFDATDYNVRFKTRQSFASGPDAANITSINTVIKHLGTLDGQIDNLQNTSFGWLNKPLQETRMALADKGQQEAVSAFQITKKLAAGELAKAIQGGPAHVQELKEINDILDSAKTPTELHAAVKAAMGLLSSRLEEVGTKYNNAMGLNSHPTSFLSKSNLKMYNHLSGLPEDTPQEIEGATPSDKQPVSGGGAKPAGAQVTKVLRGVTYIQKPDGSWLKQ